MTAMIQGFNRLKGVFRSKINFSNYNSLTETAGRKITGNLPDDLLGLVLQNPKQKSESIKGVQSAFEDAANALGNINKLEMQAINRYPVNRSSVGRHEALAQKYEGRFWVSDPVYAEKELETLIKAEELLFNGIKKEIPKTKNVVLTPLGCGQFANAYKCEILGENGQKLVSDKVIKVYRDKIYTVMEDEKLFNFINSNAFEDFLKETIKNEKDPNKLKRFQKMFDKLAAYRRLAKKQLQQTYDWANKMEKIHGAAAEANTAEYLRYFSGHKVNPSEGILIPDMFGLGETKFALSEFIGKATKAVKDFSFERLGVQHLDYKYNPRNGINGVCIDIGGITPAAGKEVVGNKQGLRILKSLFSNNSSVSSKQERLNDVLSRNDISERMKQEIESIFIKK